MTKSVCPDARSALAGVFFDGMRITAGSFGLCGIPEHLIPALRDAGTEDLTVGSNSAGVDGLGLGVLLETRQIRKVMSSYVAEKAEFLCQHLPRSRLEAWSNPPALMM